MSSHFSIISQNTRYIILPFTTKPNIKNQLKKPKESRLARLASSLHSYSESKTGELLRPNELTRLAPITTTQTPYKLVK